LKINTIFLDLDDVLNDFTMSTLRSLGCDIVDYDPKWGWDIVKAANAPHPSRSFTKETFWDSLDRKHWATIPKSEMCDWLVRKCAAEVGCKNVCILSAPTIDPDSLAGKLEWIHSSLPAWMHRQFLIGPYKHLCARPDALLIDDCDKNVYDFHEAGGHTILVPRPWNHMNAYSNNAKACVKRDLRLYFPE
jgi:5'(3')-deoxyribonucleotidase